jgi:alpha-galactosidase
VISRRGFLTGAAALSAGLAGPALPEIAIATPSSEAWTAESAKPAVAAACENRTVRILSEGSKTCLWSLQDRASGEKYSFTPPVFPFSNAGPSATAVLNGIDAVGGAKTLPNGVMEYAFEGRLTGQPEHTLRLIFQLAQEGAVVRFRYSLVSEDKAFSFDPKRGRLTYLATSLAGTGRVTEVQLSNWNVQMHSNMLVEMEVPPRFFMDRVAVAGPILVAEPVTPDSKGSPVGSRPAVLLAYEHGSQLPDTFLHFDLHPDWRAELVAVKGNYVPGLAMRRFDTVWMEAAVSAGGIEGLAGDFRSFVAHAMDTNGGSRKPYLFFNTWNFQERDKWWNGKDYLASYTESKLIEEIEVAHRLGVEVSRWIRDGTARRAIGTWT